MALLNRKERLKKELGLLDVYTISTATTLSGGLFLLPGIAFAHAGSGVLLSYLAATIPLIPTLFSMVELSTAMPRSGGFYYFLDRSMGPLVGTVGGIGTWVALILKTAFALIGIGAYLRFFIADAPAVAVAVGGALFFGVVNLFGAKKTSFLQMILAFGLLAILGWFDIRGLWGAKSGSLSTLFSPDTSGLWSTAGLVVVSYIGLTKVVSLSEEVKDPERTLPWGVFLAFGTVLLVYVGAVAVMLLWVDPMVLSDNLTPVASAALPMGGRVAVLLVSAAAILSFLSVANAGILSASRFPLAMSRDHLMPGVLRLLTRHRTPFVAVLVTVSMIIVGLVAFDPAEIAELASAFLLLVFALNCLAVIVMRESRIESYDPGYRSPFYPWMQLLGIVSSVLLILGMGLLDIVVLAVFLVAGSGWYLIYGRRRIARTGAVFHVFYRIGEWMSRLGRERSDESLDPELRSILKEKGLRHEDPFDEVIAHADVLDLPDPELDFESVARLAAERLSLRLHTHADELFEGFMQGTRIGMTPVSEGVSLPHLRLLEIERPAMVLVRAAHGVEVEVMDVYGDQVKEQNIRAFFFLVSPEAAPKQHLRILAKIAERVDDEDFMPSWLSAHNEQVLKEILMRDERFLTVRLLPEEISGEWIGKSLRELSLPDGVIIALIRRQGEIIIPRGNTRLESGDRLTILGEPANMRRLQRRFSE